MTHLYKYLIFFSFITLMAVCFFLFTTQEQALIENSYSYHNALKKKYGDLSYSQLKKLPKRDRPDLAFLQDYEMTMDPNLGYPPVHRKLKAYKVLREKLASKVGQMAAVPGVSWTERGPNNVGGRTRALMFDPNDPEAKKAWAGAVGGGLWFNTDITDPTSLWQSVDDLMANLAISTIAYDPANTQNFYLGTGLGYTSDIQGLGIWKSEDGGSSWNQLTSTDNQNFYFVQKVAVLNDGVVLASTNTGLFKSEDDGTSWEEVLSGLFADIEVASDGTVYATEGINSSGSIHKSTDQGQNWTEITPDDDTSPRRIEMTSAPSNPDRLYAVADGGVGNTDVAWFKKSNDGGTTWLDIPIPLYVEQDCEIGRSHFTRGQAFFDLILAVHPQNEDIVLAGGINIHRSFDAGNSWAGVSYWTGGFCDDYVHADQHAIAFRPGHSNEAIFGSDGGVSYSANVGNATNPEFDERLNGYNVTTFYSCATSNELNSNYFLAGAQDNGTQQFSQAGVGSTREATGGDGAYCFVDQDDSQIQITSFVFNSYRLSQDGGVTFTSISDDQSKGRFINPTDYDNDADILYGAGSIDEITRISNVSATPSQLETVPVELSGRQITTIKVSPYTANRLFVGVRVNTREGLIFRIDEAHTSSPSTTEITGSYTGSHGGWVSSIDVGASDDQLLATFSNYGVSSVYETHDGGDNWTDKNDNLPDMPVRWGLYNPNNRNQVLLATELGVWSTNDISASNPAWEPTNSGLANVRCDMLKYRDIDGTVVVATYGRGLYTTNIFATTIDANFETKQQVGYVGVPVNFLDASLLAGGSWEWDFGDGGNSSEQNPSHVYSTPGTYDISLTVDGGMDTELKQNYVTILPTKPTPYTLADGGNFESNPNDYTSQALLNGVDHWERGTPSNRLTTVSSGTNAWKTVIDDDISDEGFDYASALYTPAFDLSAAKDYSVKFKKSMENGGCNGPHALQLQYSIDGGISWYTLGSSQGDYGAVNWYNRGDNTGCSIEQSIFTNKIGWNGTFINGTDNSVDNENTEYKLNFLAGQSNVSFRFVSGVITGFSSYDRDGFMIDDFEINATEATADFDAENTVAFVNQAVQFNYRSNGALSFEWDFGDGSSSTDENPLHIYSQPGVYSVSLEIVNQLESVSNTRTDYILVLPQRDIPYELSDGGNFDVNVNDFGVENILGTAFELGTSTINGKDGTTSGNNAWVTGLTDDEYADDSEARLFTPSFGFNTLGTYTLEFKAKFSFEDNWDGFIVQYSTDLGESWIKLNDNVEEGWYNQTSEPESVFGVSVPIFSGSTDGEFETFATDVSFIYPNNNVIFRFLFLTDANTVDVGMAIDDFQLLGPTPGPAMADFTTEGISGCDEQVVTYTNASTGTISSLEWNFGANADPQTASGLGPHKVTYTSDTPVTNTVSLTVESPVNGTQIDERFDFIAVAPVHSPSYSISYNSDSEAVLTASDGDSYQWYQDEEIIEGATDQVLITSDFFRNYSVDVNVGGCVVNTGDQQVVAGIEGDLENSLIVYPNPSSDNIKLKIANDYQGEVKVRLINIMGREVFKDSFNKQVGEKNIVINLANQSGGTYYVEVILKDNKLRRKIIKK